MKKNRIGNQQYFYIYTYTQKFTERVLKVDLVVFKYFPNLENL